MGKIFSNLGTATRRNLLVAALCIVASGPLVTAGERSDVTDSNLRRASESGRFDVAIRSRRQPLPVNEMHGWSVLVRDRDLRPVLGAKLEIDGGMPGHGHGFPTQPRFTRELGNGWYLVEGVKFSMPGDWRFVVTIDDGDSTDVAQFDVLVTAWDGSDVQRLRSLSIRRLPPPPADPSNRWADSSDARTLGHRIFFDPGFSRDDGVSCSTCHKPELAFTDGLERSRGLGTTARNAPTVIGAAWSPWQFWDGRSDSLWSQALGPFEDPAEMGTTRLAVARRIAADPHYRDLYERAFGPITLPDSLPNSAGPRGTPIERDRWESMSAVDRDRVNRLFANIGKALAAYQRMLRPTAARFDRYAEGLMGRSTTPERLSSDEQAGLRMLLSGEAHCLRCHNGPRWTNDGFHNVGTSTVAGDRDVGRLAGLDAVLDDPFNCLGAFSDAPANGCAELAFIQRADLTIPGAFKVPSLRNLSLTGPYGHAGQFATLRDVLEHYNAPGPPGTDHREIEPMGLSSRQLEQIEAFLRTLDSPLDVDSRWTHAPRRIGD